MREDTNVIATEQKKSSNKLIGLLAVCRHFFHSAMYCLQWLIPVLLIPKPVNPVLLYNHVVFMILYLFSFFIERKPCTICSLVFIFAVVLICSSGYGNCLFWNDEDNQCPLSKEVQGMYSTYRSSQ